MSRRFSFFRPPPAHAAASEPGRLPLHSMHCPETLSNTHLRSSHGDRRGPQSAKYSQAHRCPNQHQPVMAAPRALPRRWPATLAPVVSHLRVGGTDPRGTHAPCVRARDRPSTARSSFSSHIAPTERAQGPKATAAAAESARPHPARPNPAAQPSWPSPARTPAQPEIQLRHGWHEVRERSCCACS